jgi:hypothetical protein
MEPIQYLKAIRGRWLIVVLVVAVGLSAAWLTRAVGAKTDREEKRQEYTASAVL